jgi:hypothetical protein
MLTRRQFALALAAPLAVSAQPAALQARIKIDSDRRIGAIDPKIYGNFAEHLGRCIEGGLFEEGSPLSDQNGYRKDVRQAVKDLDVTLLRGPRWQLLFELQLEGRHRPARPAARPARNGLGHRRKQPLRHP